MAVIEGYAPPSIIELTPRTDTVGSIAGYFSDPAPTLYLMRARVLATGATTYWVSREPSAVGAPTGPTAVTDVVIFKRLEMTSSSRWC